jgi:hypothetical protein
MNDTQEDKKDDKGKKKEFEIEIDRERFRVSQETITGAELRTLPDPDIGPDRDLFETVHGPGADVLIGAEDVVELDKHTRFFTAPSKITPGGDAPSR